MKSEASNGGQAGRPVLEGDLRPGDEDADLRYRRVVEQSGVGLFQTAVSGEIRWVNTAAARICGYEDAPDFLAAVSNVRDLYVDPARRDEFLALFEASDEVSGFEYEIRHKNDSIRWISVGARAIRNDAGDLLGFEGVIHDVTDRKLLEASVAAVASKLDPVAALSSVAEVLRRVIPFQQLTLAVVGDGTYRRLVSLAGSPGERGLPTGVEVSLEDNSMGEVVRTGSPVLVQDTSRGPWRFDRQLDAAGVGSYAIFPLIDESGVFATFNIGMRDRDAIPEDVFSILEKHATGVAHGVKNILAFETQRQVLKELEELDALKNEFFASVSHDLRNPLAVVKGIAGALQDRWDSVDEERKREMLATISSNTDRVLNHLRRDLDAALLESGEMQFEARAFVLDELVTATARAFSDAEPGRRIECTVAKSLPLALGDPDRYVQVTENLLGNALKFSPPASTIHVEVELAGPDLQVSVTDQGPGLDEHQRAVVFQKLRRLDESKPGLGIGLYVARSMVEAQRGRIWVESEPGQGATFRFTVPVAPSSPAPG